MPRFIVRWATVAISLWVATQVVSGIEVRSFTTLAVAALVLGFVNACVRPVLAFFAFPITLATLGLFYLVVNGAAFGFAAWLVPGFTVAGLGSAIFGAVVVSAMSWFVGLFTREDRSDKKK